MLQGFEQAAGAFPWVADSVKVSAFGYAIFYGLSVIVAFLPSFFMNRRTLGYVTIGASGGVSAVVACAVLFDPEMKVVVYGVPLNGPLYLLGYLIISAVMAARNSGRINHSAHFWGAAVGVVVAQGLGTATGRNLIQSLLQQIS